MSATISYIFGAASALLVAGVFTGVKMPLIVNEKSAIIALLVLGMAACAPGIGRVSAVNGWAHPVSILGYLVGALIFVVAGAALMGKSLPLVADGRAALIAVLALMVVKYILTLAHPLLH
jgi:hypothetical protein